MKKRFIFLFLIALGCAACKEPKERIIPFKGRLVEYGTNEPIANAVLYVLCYDGAFLGPATATRYDEILTGPDGTFHKEYSADELCGGAFIIAYKKGYYKRELDFADSGLQGDIVLDPEAWIKVVTVPDKEEVQIWFRGSFSGASGWDRYRYKGIEEEIFATMGNRKHSIRWGNYSSSGLLGQDSVFLPAHKTITYTIHY